MQRFKTIPFTQLACPFAALFHDVNHPGVPHAQMVKEELPLNEINNHRSVAKQTSLALSWLLMFNDEFQ